MDPFSPEGMQYNMERFLKMSPEEQKFVFEIGSSLIGVKEEDKEKLLKSLPEEISRMQDGDIDFDFNAIIVSNMLSKITENKIQNICGTILNDQEEKVVNGEIKEEDYRQNAKTLRDLFCSSAQIVSTFSGANVPQDSVFYSFDDMICNLNETLPFTPDDEIVTIGQTRSRRRRRRVRRRKRSLKELALF